MHFMAMVNFHSDELHSDYVAGLIYEAREADTVLLGLVPQWVEEGKVREGGPAPEVSGSGTVSQEI